MEDVFKLGYVQATADYQNFLQALPQRHGSEILFNRDVYAEECNQYTKDIQTRAGIRAEQKIKELIELKAAQQTSTQNITE